MVGEASVWVQGRRDTLEVRPDPSLPQGDYRQLVHELDEAEYRDIRLMVMEIRNAYVRRRGWAEAAFHTHSLTLQAGGEGLQSSTSPQG